MSTAMPVLETERLTVRPFVPDDLEIVHRVLSDAWNVPLEERPAGLPARERWLRWTILSYEALAGLEQPPYGDRAVVLREGDRLIGSAGLVPAFGPFGKLPGIGSHGGSPHFFPEVGLFWAIDPGHQRHGYATEAARALIRFAFESMNLGRIVATTEHTNEPSKAVMRKLGMRLLRNPDPEPGWFQVVGVLERG